MARIHHARPLQQQGASRTMALEKTRAAVKKKKPYKIVLEAVTQEKKKLHSILTYAANAPQGFGFVPAGHPEITEWCKEQCRQRNLDVHVVSAKPKNKMHADPEKLSHHVHRIGHHFPLSIIELACSKFGYEYDADKGLRKAKTSDRENWMIQQVENYSSRQALHGRPTTEKGTKDHISGAVREMFPKIPEEDLSSIVNHAFEEGTNRVGNAKELSLARRVQLAVVAHIRHTYTDYDKMLKTGSWMEARQKVEHVSLAKLKEWRDETGEQSNEIEDTFREVIVLDDDEDGSSDAGDTPDEREQSMEIVSNRVYARDIQPERYAQYPSASDHERRRGYGRTIFVHPYPPPPATYSDRAPQSRVPATRSVRAQDLPARTEPVYSAHSKPQVDSRTRQTIVQPETRRAPALMRDSNGRIYELQPIDDAPPRVEYDPAYRAPPPRHIQDSYVYTSPRPDAQYSRVPLPPSRRASEQETVLPSVERETVDLVSPPRTPKDQHFFPDHNDVLREYNDVQSFKRKAYPPAPQPMDGHYSQPDKRRKPSLYEYETYPKPGPPQVVEHPQMREYHTAATRSRHKANPSQETVDLTSSPRQSAYTRAPDPYVTTQSYPARPSNYAYAPEVTRRSPMRFDYHDQPVGSRPHAYIPETDRMYQRRPPPAHDYIPLRR